MQFTELADVIDLHKSGLRFFLFCADSISLLSNTLESMTLFSGGAGGSQYIPILGSKVP